MMDSTTFKNGTHEEDDPLIATTDEPPSYSQSSMPNTHATSPVQAPVRTTDFHAYRLPSSTISTDHVVVTTTQPELSTNASDLLTVIKEQVALPPRPTMRIVGQHSEYGAGYGPDKIDFDLTLDATGLLGDKGVLHVVQPTAKENGRHEEKGLHQGDQSATLSNWAKAYCESVSQCKRCEHPLHLLNPAARPFVPHQLHSVLFLQSIPAL